MNEPSKRLFLRVSVKLMLLVGIGITAYALLSSVAQQPDAPDDAPQPLRIPLNAESSTVMNRIAWEGGNLVMVRRSPAQLSALSQHQSALLDPDSRDARQPEGLPASSRSFAPSVFIAYDRGTDMGCPLNWVGPGDHSAPHQPWPGGFRDTCRGSWYDAAGRVFRGQQASRNLDIPPYRVIGPDLLEIGGNGDNPASTK